ncbi:ABC transporter permease [Acidobacteriota bacterium]
MKKQSSPPRLARWILVRLSHYEKEFSIVGDCSEEFKKVERERGLLSARIWIWGQVFGAVPSLLKLYILNSGSMLRHYLTIALRNIKRHKTYSIINIFGLGTGLACCILATFFIHDEVSYDRFHRNLDDIYGVRVFLTLPMGRVSTDTQFTLGPTFSDSFPEVAAATRIGKQNLAIKYRNRIFDQKGLAADPDFFRMFDFPMKAGSSATAIDTPQSIVLCETMARKYFGSENPIGRTMAIRIEDEDRNFIVTGILKDTPSNSSLRFDYVLNLRDIYGDIPDGSTQPRHVALFVQLKRGYRAESLEGKFKGTIDVPLVEKYGEESGHELYALAEYHLKEAPGAPDVLEGKSNPNYSYILGGIALLVLLIACFNFMNLSLGWASSRLKEIGMRKVLGARKRQFIRQFWFESLLLNVLALVLGLGLAGFFIPAFNRLSGKTIQLDLSAIGLTAGILGGLILLVGIVVGSYPALVLTRFPSVELFRGKLKLSMKNSFSRILIVFQFSISIFLIVSTVFLLKQHRFLIHQNLGYNYEQILVIPFENFSNDSARNKSAFSVLKNKLLSHEGIQSVSGAKYGMSPYWMATFFEDKEEAQFITTYNHVDPDFIETLGIKILKGRDFRKDSQTDVDQSVIVNELFINKLGIEDPIGRKFSEFFNSSYDRTIIGVLQDFNTQSLHDEIKPAFIDILSDESIESIFLKIRGDSLPHILGTIRDEFNAVASHIPFSYTFLEEEIARQYEKEERWSRLVTFASIFALLIACSGLFGLSLLIIVQRTKEIGIRKVLGASVSHIAQLVSREFIWLILAANVAAWPASYLLMSTILKNYPYRIGLAWWVFAAAGGLALLTAILTIGFHTVRAVRSDPIQSLKYE